uniref:hypothetical protein n=1 Tax=uncultured Draconibacterium sp. TaxID=1573823 RepID=UPI003217711E
MKKVKRRSELPNQRKYADSRKILERKENSPEYKAAQQARERAKALNQYAVPFMAILVRFVPPI